MFDNNNNSYVLIPPPPPPDRFAADPLLRAGARGERLLAQAEAVDALHERAAGYHRRQLRQLRGLRSDRRRLLRKGGEARRRTAHVRLQRRTPGQWFTFYVFYPTPS